MWTKLMSRSGVLRSKQQTQLRNQWLFGLTIVLQLSILRPCRPNDRVLFVRKIKKTNCPNTLRVNHHWI